MVQLHGVDIPTTYEDAVRVLAEAHGTSHGAGTEIYRCDWPGEGTVGGPAAPVLLLEVNPRFPSAKGPELRATRFGSARDFPFASAVILASPGDVDRLRESQLRLPSGWHFSRDRRVWPR